MISQDIEAERLKLELRLSQLEAQDRARINFIDFVRYVWPEAILGEHHIRMASAFDRLAKGSLKRLIINMPPRHTKSEFASYLLPAYLMGREPRTKAIEATHNSELAVRFGRKVRDLMDMDRYKELFPDVSLKADSKAAGRWDTNKGGEYFAVGVGGAMTGRGADVLIIDDPHSEQDAMSDLALDNAWEWYISGPRTRLQPGGAIVIVMCMTGDTRVLMADGSEKFLSDVRAGDMVATFDDGALSTARINNWRSSGVDSIYRVQTRSGKILRANERHPFLVMKDGVLKWTRLSQLRVGDRLVSLKDAKDRLGQKQSQGCVPRVWQDSPITESTLKHRTCQLGTMESGRTSVVLSRGARGLLQVEAYAPRTTARSTFLRRLLNRLASTVSRAGMGSLLNAMMKWFGSAITGVMFVGSRLHREILAPIGMQSSALTMTMPQGGFAVSYATTATLQLDTGRPRGFLNELRHTSDFTVDEIVSIRPDGQEEVFDVEVDRTENFIANGVVSHNTRWGTKDLTARLLKAQSSHNADRWEVIEFPAILPSGKPLWPQFWKIEELEGVKASLSVQKWNAMYQQQPTNDEGAILKREWWRVWPHDEPPIVNYIIQSMDTAYSKKETADFSVITTWGVFYPGEDEGANIILLDVKRGRWDFPELKRVAKEQYDHWQPDNVLIEAKATGITLQQELRRMSIPVTLYSPGGRRAGTDKISRANAVAPIFESGMVWAPDTDWAEALVEECAAFPNGDNDDQVDSTVQAMMRFRQGNFIALKTDEIEESRDAWAVPEYY